MGIILLKRLNLKKISNYCMKKNNPLQHNVITDYGNQFKKK